MRIYAAFFLLGAFLPGAAHASSFVTLEPITNGVAPSIITLGASKPIAAATTAQVNVALAFPLPGEPGGKNRALAAPSGNPLAEDGQAMPERIALAYPLPGEADAAISDAAPVVISASIIALGPPPEPAVSPVKTASIAPRAKHHPFTQPTVIRGGIVGDAFAQADPAPPAQGSPTQASARSGDPTPVETPPDAPVAPEAPPAPTQPPPLLRGPE